MMTVPTPPEEKKRLAALRALGVLDTDPDPELDAITRLAADLFDVPIALVSLVDDERQWFKSKVGLDLDETPRNIAFCGYTIASDDQLVILDTLEDPRFADHVLVTGAPYIRFYAAAPLVLKGGERVGTLCLIARQPRHAFTEREARALDTLARQVVSFFENRRSLREQKIAQLIGETATDAFVASNSDGEVTYWNKGAELLFGYSAAEAVGAPLDIIVPPEHRGAHLEGMKRLRAGGTPRLVGKTIEVPSVRKDGERLMVELTLSMWSDEPNGIPSGFASIMRDVSQRVMTERKLAEQVAAIEAAHEGIAIASPDGIATYMNRAYLDMFGLPGGANDIPWSHVCAAHERERMVKEAFPQLRDQGKWNGDVQGLRADGHLIDCEVSLTLSDNTVVAVIRDMTQRRESEREMARLREQLLLAQRQEACGQLAAGLAHDFNNLIAAIGGSAALIETLGDEDVRRHADRISRASQDAGSLVDKLQKMGRRDPDYEDHDLRRVVEDVAELVQSGLAREQRLTLELAPEPMIARVDRSELLQVLLNLALNAREALRETHEGQLIMGVGPCPPAPEAEVLVGRLPEGPTACLWVEDNGVGIAPEMLSQIFRPFFTRKVGSGSGLGLAMVASIVEASGAGVGIDSTPGKGSRFVLYWPLEPRERPGTQTLDIEPVDPRALEGLRLLVVDDEPAVAETLAALFESAGAEVGTCVDPGDALEAIEEDPDAWDVLVTDFDMPGLDGAALAERARALVPTLPLLLITALPEANRLKARCGETFDLIGSKVAPPRLLVGMVREAIARADARRKERA